MKPCSDERVFGSAKYIKAQKEPADYSLYDPAPLFRREFDLKKDIRKAKIFVQSPGFAHYFINGQPITEDLFISAVSDYRKILWYNTYDVTSLLRPGKNVIGVITGNGFLNESFESAWHYQTVSWRDAPQFLLRLTVNGQTALVSDGSWHVTRENSPIIYHHLRSGEYWDMRKKDDRWLTAGYDDSAWDFALENPNPPKGALRPVSCPPVREKEVVSPVSVTPTAKGCLVDFGVNISGYMEIILQAERGSEIIFRYTEEVDEQLRPRYNHMNDSVFYPVSPFHLNKMIASGGVDTFKPVFSYHGFRYVLIEGLRDASSAENMRAYFIHQDVARISDFSSGNEIINYIYRAGIRSTYSNLFWSLTDCPTREKLGWANDAQSSVEQTLINFDILSFYEKWFEDLKSCMREDGALPGIIPSPDWGYQYGPVCDGLLYELPYRIYLYTGRTHMMTEAIPYFERYLTYLTKRLQEGYSFALGDWMGYTSSKRIPKTFVWDFYRIKALRITVLAHRLAGSKNTAWQEKLALAEEAFMNNYLDADGLCVIAEQSSVAMMLMMGLYRDWQILADQLVKVVLRDECVLTCGMVGTQYIYDALARCGRGDLSIRLMTESLPGYKTWYENGATTLWERWDGQADGSHNHHMFSGVLAWFFKFLLGICPTEEHPGFEMLELRPCFVASLGFVRGYTETVKGRIEAAWRWETGHFVYTVTLSEGMCATYRGQTLMAGSHTFLIEQEDFEA